MQTIQRFLFGLVAACLVLGTAGAVFAQGVTTGTMTGIVKDAQGGVMPGVSVTATHEPSGTTYEAVTQADGRFFIPAMRVGGPYTVKASITGFKDDVKSNQNVTLGASTDLAFALGVAGVAEAVTVVGTADTVFSSSRTGASTAVLREELAVLPTVSGRMNDMTRLTPQSGGGGTFAGQDNRLNNITVDGSYFNNSFGLAGQPGDRTGVAPISLEAIEQVQVSVAPFDVRQGNFVGAGVNTVTRSGTNSLSGSFYYRYRDEGYVGKKAGANTFNPGTFKTTDIGEWVGGPIIKSKLFFFESYEKQEDTRPLTTYLANPGGVAAGGNITRVLASDLNAISSFLSQNFKYDTGPYEGISKKTPGKPFLMKFDYNINGANKVTFRYNQLDSVTPVNLSSSSSLGNGRQTFSTNFLNFANSNYSILENIKSGIGEWNTIFKSTLANNLIIGYTKQDESRGDVGNLFPFIDILDGAGTAYTSVGTEPFTPNNELRYNTFQMQDSFTKFGKSHSLTFGGAFEKYHSENVFFPGKQSVYIYNTLADFYTDLQGYLANPNRTVSPVNLRRFQVRYMNLPNMEKPVQPLDVYYTSLYAQDEWRPRSNMTVTAGIRMDVAKFGNTAYDNPAVDALTFRDASGGAIQYNTGALPKATPLWSPRLGFNWDVKSDATMQVRGGTGVFTGKPAYVWISNQIGNTGMLTGLIDTGAGSWTNYPFNPKPEAYKPANVTGAPAASVDLAVTDPNFKFPQTWRTNVAIDQRVFWGMIATAEYIYNKDVNGVSYINANLPASQSAFTGVDSRPRWTGTSCVATGNPTGSCVTRINNAIGNAITQNIVLGNQNDSNSSNFAVSITRPLKNGVTFKAAYSYGTSQNTVDPGSIASGSWTGNAIVRDPNNPVVSNSSNMPLYRFFINASYTKKWFKWGATTVSGYFTIYPGGQNSYIFAADANGDSATNDLIYIPRNTAEMNFVQFTSSGVTFTPADQAAAFDAFISQDKYLSAHRGAYAERNAVFYPSVKRMDLSFMQDIYWKIGSSRHSGQIRLDILNFGNMLNKNWGIGYSMYQNRILTNPAADANGALSYRLATVSTSSGPQLISKTYLRTAGSSDVYTLMLSFRYGFN